MILKYSGQCSRCGIVIPKGVEVEYDAQARKIFHRECQQEPVSQEKAESIADRLGFFDAREIRNETSDEIGREDTK